MLRELCTPPSGPVWALITTTKTLDDQEYDNATNVQPMLDRHPFNSITYSEFRTEYDNGILVDGLFPAT